MKDLKRLWLISLLIKLLVAALLPLSADEAYYWVWSHNLRLSYFDHPPMVSWLFYMGHFLENFLHAARWPAVIMGHATLLVWISLLKPHVDLQKIKIWLYLALFSPLIGFGSLIVTPDVAIVFFWSLSLFFLQKALESKRLQDYLFLGAALGLGFCAKYHIVLFIPFLFLYLFVEKRWRDVQWKFVPTTVLSGLLFCTPVLLWNYQNDFASFQFQLKHGLERPDYQFSWTWSYVLGQILALFPLVAWAAIKLHIPKKARLFIYFGWGPLAFFFLTSFKALVEVNWPIIGYPAIFALALFHPKIKKWTVWSSCFWGALYIVVLSTLFTPPLRNLNEKISEPFRLQALKGLPEEYQPLFANNYQVASSLWYFSKIPVYKLNGMSRYDFFDTLDGRNPTGNHFYLLKYERNSLPPWVSEQEWDVSEVKKIAPDFVLLKIEKK
ncbi:hypothetical protein D3C87_87890 [compost metagenome]